MRYIVETKNGPRAKWKPIGRHYPTREAAVMFAQSLDEDGLFRDNDPTIRVREDAPPVRCLKPAACEAGWSLAFCPECQSKGAEP